MLINQAVISCFFVELFYVKCQEFSNDGSIELRVNMLNWKYRDELFYSNNLHCMCTYLHIYCCKCIHNFVDLSEIMPV